MTSTSNHRDAEEDKKQASSSHQYSEQNVDELNKITSGISLSLQRPNFVAVGKLVATRGSDGEINLATSDQPLKPIFQGGLNGLPSFEQRLSQEEWSLIRSNSTKKRKKKRNKLKTNLVSEEPPKRKPDELIPCGVLRYRIPPALNVRAKDHTLCQYVQLCVQKKVQEIIRSCSTLSEEEKEFFLAISPVHYIFIKGQPYIHVQWSNASNFPSLAKTQFSYQGHELIYFGAGSMHEDEWMSFSIIQVPSLITPTEIFSTLQAFLEDVAFVREVWYVYHQNKQNELFHSSQVICLIESNLEKATSIKADYLRNLYVWRRACYGFIRLGDQICELDFLGRSDWCPQCKHLEAPQDRRHLTSECPFSDSHHSGERDHPAKL